MEDTGLGREMERDKRPDDLLVAFMERLATLSGFKGADDRAAGGPWIVGLSGGPDSVALCHLVCRAREAGYGGGLVPERVVALHVNHGLRGGESNRDQAFAEALAADLAMEYRQCRLRPPEAGRPGSLEAWARKHRYTAFIEASAALQAAAVLTGHHKNDQAETVIQRLARGAGIQGLSGIRPSRPLVRGAPVRLLRPLLSFTRSQIMDYLEARALPYVTDRSNLDPAMQRNRIRLQVLPRLESAFPDGDLLDTLAAIADESGEIQALLEEAAERTLAWAGLRGSGKAVAGGKDRYLPFAGVGSAGGPEGRNELCLDRARLRKVHPLVLQPLLKSAGFRVTGLDDPPLSRRAFREARDILASGRAGAAVRFGSEWEMALLEDHAVVRGVKAAPPLEPSPAPLPLPVPGSLTLPDNSRISARLTEDRGEGETLMRSPDPLLEVLDGDRAGSRLFIRRRRQGDRFQPLGLSRRVKLKNFLMDLKVPREDRDRIALVCNEEEILWVVGLRIHHAFRVTPATKRFLILKVPSTH